MERKSQFQFKKFTVSHAKSTMKVGTDTVLLGAWINVGTAHQLLDIGTGNGTLALMLAQRSSDEAAIDAVEIEEADVLQANENFIQSPWASKIHLYHTAVQHFHPEKKYDLIISNPPYFNDSQRPPDEKRHKARHTVSLDHEELIHSVLRLLKDKGRFNAVLPFTEGLSFIDLAKGSGLSCTRKYSFKTRPAKPIERWLLEFQKTELPLETGEILLYKNDQTDDWSDEYKQLTQAFYLKL
jgi:tRNA1Val (adenine37-N6)-methyltransferase